MMKHFNVGLTVDMNLCTSCGVCKGICPVSCIEWQMQRGMYYPKIDNAKCTRCGLCAKVCPGLSNTYPENSKPQTAVMGESLFAINAWSKNEEIRHKSASGGVVTTIVSTLLEKKLYDMVFCVGTYDYSKQLKMKKTIAQEFLGDNHYGKYPKSRYLPVSHEDVISFIKENKEKKRAIIIGSPCALRGITETIGMLNKERELYLLIGFFCDKVFNYNIYKYFCDKFSGGKKVSEIHFKNKESGGWPGDMKFIFEDGETSYQSIKERMRVKDYFVPERCCYCVDKLNVCADISLGDNYTTKNSSKLGSNSVIIRTERGKKAWETSEPYLEFDDIDVKEIGEAQGVEWRLNNFYYGMLRQRLINRKYKTNIQLNSGIIPQDNFLNYEWRWKRVLSVLEVGSKYQESPKKMEKMQKRVDQWNNPQKKSITLERVYYAIKRRVLGVMIFKNKG